MVARLIDGFGHYPTADFLLKYTSLNGTPTISAGTNPYGGAAYRPGSQLRYINKTLDSQATWIVGFRVKVTSNPSAACPIFNLSDAGTIQCSLVVNTDNTLSVVRSTGTALTNGTSVFSFSSGTWYYIEFKVTIADSISAGTCKVRANGVDIITVATGQDLKSTANATANSYSLGWIGNVAGIDPYFCDFYICDGTGSVNNDFLGDVRVDLLVPTAAGNSTGWTPNTGVNYAAVDETAQDGDTTYVSASTPNTKDTYTFGNMPVSPTSIFAIQNVILAKKNDAGSKSLTPVIRSSGADYDGSVFTVGNSYNYSLDIRETDPATGVAWTESGVNSAEFGIKLLG